jgi:hypothetical protein
MIDPDDAPEGWKLEHLVRVTLADGSSIVVERDDGKPVADLDELFSMLRSALGSAQRRERIRQRRREIRSGRRGQDDAAA